MVNSPEHYGLGGGLAPLRGGGDLGYDMYVEQAKTRAAAQASVAFQALQTGLLNQMSQSMNSLHAEMAFVRQQQSESLAIQQELLKREQIQTYLEEFIFQAGKLVAECAKSACTLPYSARYFLLMGVLTKVEQEGIGTAIIRGRENKQAFDQLLSNAQKLMERLRKTPEVQGAIRWAEEEQRRLEAEQEKLEAKREAEKEKLEAKRQAKIEKLEKRLGELRSQIKTYNSLDIAKDRWEQLHTKYLRDSTSRMFFYLFGGFALFIVGLFAAPLILLFALINLKMEAHRRTKECNQMLNPEISRLEQELWTTRQQTI